MVSSQGANSLSSAPVTFKYVNHAVSHKTSSSGQRAGGPLTGVTARGGRFQTSISFAYSVKPPRSGGPFRGSLSATVV